MAVRGLYHDGNVTQFVRQAPHPSFGRLEADVDVQRSLVCSSHLSTISRIQGPVDTVSCGWLAYPGILQPDFHPLGGACVFHLLDCSDSRSPCKSAITFGRRTDQERPADTSTQHTSEPSPSDAHLDGLHVRQGFVQTLAEKIIVGRHVRMHERLQACRNALAIALRRRRRRIHSRFGAPPPAPDRVQTPIEPRCLKRQNPTLERDIPGNVKVSPQAERKGSFFSLEEDRLGCHPRKQHGDARSRNNDTWCRRTLDRTPTFGDAVKDGSEPHHPHAVTKL
eukprot:scaffold1724_cov341-Pavlova_lutheri.AAC.73